MKKKSIFLTAVLLLIMFAAVSAGAAEKTRLSYGDGYVKITSETGDVYVGTLIGVVSENGILTKVKAYESVSGSVFVNDDFYNGEHVKFMYWNGLSELKPMAESIEADISGAEDMPKSVTLKASDFDYEKNADYENSSYTEAGKLHFNGDTAVSYDISPDVKLFVNGVEYGDTDGGIGKYLAGNDMSDVILTDYADEDSGSTDGVYDTIEVNYYIDMVVDRVEDAQSDFPTVYAVECETGDEFWELNPAVHSYKFLKDGMEISVSDIAAGDVLSIKYDVTKSLSESGFCEVLVSSNIVRGEIDFYDSERNICEINGTEYKAHSMLGRIELFTEYKLYIDAFGRITYADEIVQPKQLAILDSVYTTRGGDFMAKLIFTDGTEGEYELKSEYADISKSIVYVNGETLEKNPVRDRVVEYSINSQNEISVKGTCEYVQKSNAFYSKEENSLGGLPYFDDTPILSVSEPMDICVVGEAMLVDGFGYDVCMYDWDAENNGYRLVLITSDLGRVTSQTSMAVYICSEATVNEQGNDAVLYTVFVDGERKDMFWESGIEPEFELCEGDAILCETNNYGEIQSVYRLFSEGTNLSDSDVFLNEVYKNSESVINRGLVQGLEGIWKADLRLGVITERNPQSFAVSEIKDNLVNINQAEELDYYGDVNVYKLDFNKKAGERVSVGGLNDILSYSVPRWTYADESSGIADISKLDKKPRLVLVRVYDGEAADICIIIPKE